MLISGTETVPDRRSPLLELVPPHAHFGQRFANRGSQKTGFRRLTLALPQNRFARRIHRKLQRLFRDAGYKRSDQPA